jgi:hypothetical protein
VRPHAAPSNGTPVTREVFGQSYSVRYQDVAGMVDIHTASPALLTAVGIAAVGFIAARARVLERWPNGTRPATLEQSLGLIEAELGRAIGVEDGLRNEVFGLKRDHEVAGGVAVCCDTQRGAWLGNCDDGISQIDV